MPKKVTDRRDKKAFSEVRATHLADIPSVKKNFQLEIVQIVIYLVAPKWSFDFYFVRNCNQKSISAVLMTNCAH